eukprot:66224-Pyramimonas_sp.AAC.1
MSGRQPFALAWHPTTMATSTGAAALGHELQRPAANGQESHTARSTDESYGRGRGGKRETFCCALSHANLA